MSRLRRSTPILAPVLVLGLAAACSQAAPSPTPSSPGAQAKNAPAGAPWFEEVARASGLSFDHVRAKTQRFWFPEIMSGGLAWLDYDRDGRLDLFVVQAGDLAPEGQAMPSDRLFRNLGGGKFEDVTERAGLVENAYGMGCTVGDYDGDGDPDLFVTNIGPDVLWRNEGDGTFVDVTRTAGVGHPGWGTSCGFFDSDNDGDLDLFVVNYIRWSPEAEMDCKSNYGERDYCAPVNYNRPAQSVLYRNEGNGTFTDASESAGLLTVFGNGLGLALVDFDRDGWLDAYVSNDGMPNQLWMNQKDGRFVDKAVPAGAAVNRNGAAEASMGTVPADLNADGFVDLFITNLRGETKTTYVNKNGVFTDRTAQTGMAMASLQYTGFGDGFADFDHDGELDLFLVNGRVGMWKPVFRADDPYAEPNQLFRGLGGMKWEEVLPQGGTAEALVGNSRGAAFADYDDDGDVDVAYSDNHGSLKLLRNVTAKKGSWIGFAVVDAKGGDVPGAFVELDAGGKRHTRLVALCSSYCSANEGRVHVGLAAKAKADTVRVRWPGGAVEEFGPFDAEAYHRLARGSGRVVK
ncbi:MAG: CRTAC1 family protein [Planctomycetes bacterium]|nr:CRTAC1 family protein [Planctomycetota bacterium]